MSCNWNLRLTMNPFVERRWCIVPLVIAVYAWTTAGTQGSQVLSKSDVMFREVWKGYEADIRPVCGDYPSPVEVSLGMAMRQLMDLDEPKQMIWTNIWLRIAWEDCRLMWNSSDYGEATRITVPRNVVWTPDLTLYDNAESKLGNDMDAYRINVYSTGRVTSLLPVVIKSMCKLNVLMFPFDTQKCNLTFGSWTYNGMELNLTTSPEIVDLSSFVVHSEWTIVSVKESVNAPIFDGVPYPQVIFTIALSRKPLFYAVNLVFPSVLIKSLAIVGFILPPESGEKVNLEITVLLSLSVFQLVVLSTMPPTSENMPIIALYFLLAMVLVALSCITTVVVLNIHFTKHHCALPRVPYLILHGCIGRAFGMRKLIAASRRRTPHSSSTTSRAKDEEAETVFSNVPMSCSTISNGVMTSSHGDGYRSHHVTPDPGQNDPLASPRSTSSGLHYSSRYPSPEVSTSNFVQLSLKVLGQLEILTSSKLSKEFKDMQVSEWRLFAVLLDRIFLCVFLVLGLILSLSVYITIAVG
ncbi:neuronal acetylcholine receptor subunit alpha-10 [Aplysia californica]|uniref:Neuronal acetylcholine receptor subunit alpha-10 n=1 Tax=Aplysia californica TaxID=6500 RepID=A0ABM1W5E9_APLCA|nr:neuronal acetylcholine receptor subunit alpha-10 [Aplysia californica]